MNKQLGIEYQHLTLGLNELLNERYIHNIYELYSSLPAVAISCTIPTTAVAT